jgi:hypothetical protein
LVFLNSSFNSRHVILRFPFICARPTSHSVIVEHVGENLQTLLWFPRWQHAPHASSTQALGFVFGAMTVVLLAICVLGKFFSPWDLGPFVQTAISAYKTFLKKDCDEKG